MFGTQDNLSLMLQFGGVNLITWILIVLPCHDLLLTAKFIRLIVNPLCSYKVFRDAMLESSLFFSTYAKIFKLPGPDCMVPRYQHLTRIGIIIHSCTTKHVDVRVCNELLRVTKRVYMSSSKACDAFPVKELLSYCEIVGADVSACHSFYWAFSYTSALYVEAFFDAEDLEEAIDVPIELLSLQYDYLDVGLLSEPCRLWYQGDLVCPVVTTHKRKTRE